MRPRLPGPVPGGGVVAAPLVEVSGGAGRIGLEAQAALDVATALDAAAERLRGWALDPPVPAGPLAATAVLDGVGAAAVSAALAEATVGPSGLLRLASALRDDADATRQAALELDAADVAAADAMRALEGVLGLPLAAGLVGGAVGAVAIADHDPRLDADDRARLLASLTDDPALAERTLHLAAAPLGGVPVGAGLIAGRYGPDVVEVERRPDLRAPAPGRERDLAGLVEHLGRVAELADAEGRPLEGQIEVQTLTTPQGPRHVVYLPGTDDLTTLPGGRDDTVRDMGVNQALLASGVTGGVSGYGAGVLAALRRSGVRPGEPVLLVGHSQGGLEAAALQARAGGYAFRHVVTAGSPLSGVAAPPPGSRLLALENVHDVVPAADGAPNDAHDRRLTTVRGDAAAAIGTRPGRVVEEHGFPSYQSIAAAADRSPDTSIRDQLDALRADGFLGRDDVPVTSRVFRLRRP
ncbi:hypothetical protein K8Z61_14990 [Nocardioides sp. TRM66260-LWL]|uniref:hypothetical protein n=1 Tax=Nocardioides sp. TRM66260-LWL TaxID=2874478 RepID=UPI001CC6CB3C|nr:hypothetical protein [Nocardioides sp. TRM66260-LWL]MBZ5735798.1 hypothetical protein [Nocardioides sp. TRM66260-LWL]